jgi:hypothetical protein
MKYTLLLAIIIASLITAKKIRTKGQCSKSPNGTIKLIYDAHAIITVKMVDEVSLIPEGGDLIFNNIVIKATHPGVDIPMSSVSEVNAGKERVQIRVKQSLVNVTVLEIVYNTGDQDVKRKYYFEDIPGNTDCDDLVKQMSKDFKKIQATRESTIQYKPIYTNQRRSRKLKY